MTARVLVVDDLPANVKLLEARLTAEYFDVLTAMSGQEALDILATERIDVVLLDVMMPGMDGFETCRRIKSNLKTHHIPVVMVTALDQAADKIQGLENGADDFLTKPVDDIALVTRVKNLARLKTLNDELIMRAATGRELGMAEDTSVNDVLSGRTGRILVVDDHPRSALRLLQILAENHEAYADRDPRTALHKLTEHNFDLVIVSLSMQSSDGLRLCSQLRSMDATRHLPIIILVEPGDDARLLRGLDMGINDYLMQPIEKHELLARVRTQVKRKRHSDFLRNRLEASVEMAVTDSLTGLHNRRYMETHLKTLLGEAAQKGLPLSVIIADIDHFKQVNDTYGHDAGDQVLKEFATRLQRNSRGVDLTCRLGGEEFVIVMPDTDLRHAFQVGERMRACIAADPFQISQDKSVAITASVGIATFSGSDETPASIYKRADNALYAAKRSGRNRVISHAA